MFALHRAVRFAVGAPMGAVDGAREVEGENGHGGVPPIEGFGAAHELEIVVKGPVGPSTGYLVDIKTIDVAARRTIVPRLMAACASAWSAKGQRSAGASDPGEALRSACESLAGDLPVALDRVVWRLSPSQSLECAMASTGGAQRTVVLRQCFEFCAGHRLHNPALSAEENRRLFGKCNNPGGHGHNYRFEPAIEIDLDRPVEARPTVAQVESVVDRCVLERFDHRNLNTDTREFGDGVGLMPSVENIALVCYELLRGPIESLGGRLVEVRVWESERTSGVYPAGAR